MLKDVANEKFVMADIPPIMFAIGLISTFSGAIRKYLSANIKCPFKACVGPTLR